MEDFNTNQNQIITNSPKQPSLFSGTSKVLIGILLGIIFTVGIIGLYSTYYKKETVNHNPLELATNDKKIIPPSSGLYYNEYLFKSDGSKGFFEIDIDQDGKKDSIEYPINNPQCEVEGCALVLNGKVLMTKAYPPIYVDYYTDGIPTVFIVGQPVSKRFYDLCYPISGEECEKFEMVDYILSPNEGLKLNGSDFLSLEGATLLVTNQKEKDRSGISDREALCQKSDDQPIIIHMSQGMSSIGTALALKGCNLSGFEGDKDIWIENRETGEKAIIHGDHLASTSASISFKFGLYECTQNTGYTGDRCPRYMKLSPGEYKLYVMPWNKKSNEVHFTITPTPQRSYGTAGIACCMITDRNFIPDRISYNWAASAECESTAQRSEGYLAGGIVGDNQCSGLKPDGVSF